MRNSVLNFLVGAESLSISGRNKLKRMGTGRKVWWWTDNEYH